MCFPASDKSEDSQDTVEQILKCIIENEGTDHSPGSVLQDLVAFK